MRTGGCASQAKYLQSGSPLLAELAMEDNDRLLSKITTSGWFRFDHAVPKEVLLHLGLLFQVQGAMDMSTGVLVVKPAVNYVIFLDLRVVDPIQ